MCPSLSRGVLAGLAPGNLNIGVVGCGEYLHESGNLLYLLEFIGEFNGILGNIHRLAYLLISGKYDSCGVAVCLRHLRNLDMAVGVCLRAILRFVVARNHHPRALGRKTVVCGKVNIDESHLHLRHRSL